MVLDFKVDEELKLLEELASVQADSDYVTTISARDIKKAPRELWDKIHLDTYLVGSPLELAKRLTDYYGQLRLASLFWELSPRLSSDGSLGFFKSEFDNDKGEYILQPYPTLENILQADASIRETLSHQFPIKRGARPVIHSHPLNNSRQPPMPVSSIKLTRAVYEELKGAYDCRTEQIYLLLQNRKTGVIEKILRPRYNEGEHWASFEEGWLEYIQRITETPSSRYRLFGRYHSHPGLKADGYAGYEPSDDDGVYKGDSTAFNLIGHAETNDCNSPNFESSFQINAYVGFEKIPVSYETSPNDPVFFDPQLEKHEPFLRGELTQTITFNEVKAFFEGVNDYSLLDRLQPEKIYSLHITFYYDGSYEINLNDQENPFFVLKYLRHGQYYILEDWRQGFLEAVVIIDYAGWTLVGKDLALVMQRLSDFNDNLRLSCKNF